MSAAPPLRARAVSRRFGGRRAARAPGLEDITFELAGGAQISVMGPSGSGKTTLLRALAGLEPIDSGELWLGERRIDGLDAARRPLRSVFQRPALFPHLSVLDNVRFVDRLGGRGRGPGADEAAALLERFGLDPAVFGARTIDALSGGERQRVALARALYRPPPWLLLDEPLSALDQSRRAQLRRILVASSREAGVGIIHVSHDPRDAMLIGERLLCLIDGRIVADGEPAALYRRPPSLALARLLGELSPAPLDRAGAWIRPERLALVAPGEGRRAAIVVDQRCVGSSWHIELALAGHAAPEPILAARPDPWEGASDCALAWDDADILELPS